MQISIKNDPQDPAALPPPSDCSNLQNTSALNFQNKSDCAYVESVKTFRL